MPELTYREAVRDTLIQAMRYDCAVVRDTPALADQIASLPCEVLLLGGTRSATTLRRVLDAIARRLPSATLERFAGLGHTAAADDGRPRVVAARLRAFFEPGAGSAAPSPTISAGSAS